MIDDLGLSATEYTPAIVRAASGLRLARGETGSFLAALRIPQLFIYSASPNIKNYLHLRNSAFTLASAVSNEYI